MEQEVYVKVAVRVRPFNESEKQLGCQDVVTTDGPQIALRDPNPYSSTPVYNFAYDFSYGVNTIQDQVYQDLGTFILNKAFEGYNGTIFAYGQTGSGKTHSISGTPDDPGIIPRMNHDLFRRIATAPENKEFLVTVSYLELYNEVIFDLLNPSTREGKSGLKVREHPKLGVYVENLMELVVSSEEDISRKMAEGNSWRHTAATKMNDRSSRSHSVFTIKVEQKTTYGENASVLHSRINLVDLAGSERVAKTEAEGNTLKEATMINKSALGNVINALADVKKRKGHIPFRSSKLTRLLQESLGGNTATIMLATVSPADRNFDETLNTLQYANRAKNIQNMSHKNETNPQALMKELRDQIEKLKEELAKGGAGDPEQVKALKETIAGLEYAKSQTWEEKQKLTKEFEAARWASLAKNGMLQFRVNLMKKQKQKLDDKINALTSEKEALKADYESQQVLIEELQRKLKMRDESSAVDKWKSAVKASKTIQEKANMEQEMKKMAASMEALKVQSDKTQSLEEKLKYKTQETEILFEELTKLKEENSQLINDVEQKQKDMDALCADVSQMLTVENDKLQSLEELTQRLTAENSLLRAELERRGIPVPVPIQGAISPRLPPSSAPTQLSFDLSNSPVELTRYTLNQYIEDLIKNDPELLVLFQASGGNYRDALSDGIIFCKLINRAAPGTIDERVLNINPVTPEEVLENINLCINSAKAIGCHISDITIEDVITGDESKLMRMVSEIERVGQLNKITIMNNQTLLNLKGNDSLNDFVKLSPEQLLMRWFNYHLANARSPEFLQNFSADLQDSIKYTLLMNQLSDKSGLEALNEPNLIVRAEMVIRNAQKINCHKFLSAPDILQGNAEMNILFVANLFNAFPTVKFAGPGSNSQSVDNAMSLTKSSELTIQSEQFVELLESEQSEKREERAIRVWINSLDIGQDVKHLREELSDGILMLKVLDKVHPGKVNWKRVNMNPQGIYKKIENCNYVVEIGKELKYSLVGIAGKDFVDGNLKFSLALLIQAMQHHFLNLLKGLRFGGKEVTEADLLKFVNEKVKSVGKTSQIKSFKDPALRDGTFLIDLLYAIRPSAVNYQYVKAASSGMRNIIEMFLTGIDEDRMVNAKYIISVARKIGCHIFLVWEDITEVKQRKVVVLVSEIIAIDSK